MGNSVLGIWVAYLNDFQDLLIRIWTRRIAPPAMLPQPAHDALCDLVVKLDSLPSPDTLLFTREAIRISTDRLMKRVRQKTIGFMVLLIQIVFLVYTFVVLMYISAAFWPDPWWRYIPSSLMPEPVEAPVAR